MGAKSRIDGLVDERDMYKHAYETTKVDRDRLSSYEHAFITTAADRDRIKAEWNALRVDEEDRRIGIAAYALLNDLRLSPETIEARFPSDDGRSARRRASDGLLSIAETILRSCHISKTAYSLIRTALELDNSFRGQHHAIHCYYLERLGVDAYEQYFKDGVANGLWPDAGTASAQAASIARGVPPILLATLPKSGSIYIWSAIEQTVQAPTFAIAIPNSMLDERLVEPLVEVFARGGMIAQHHLSASRENIEMLKRAGIQKVIVHVRDPRQAAVSWWHYTAKIGATRGTLVGADRDAHLWKKFLKPAFHWINQWLDVNDLEILFSTQEDMAENELDHVAQLLKFLSWTTADIVLPMKSERVHFRSGRKDEWREFFQPETIAGVKKLIRPDAVERFGWSYD